MKPTPAMIEAAARALNDARYEGRSPRPFEEEDNGARDYAYRLTKAALAAALAEVIEDEWRPIETLPKLARVELRGLSAVSGGINVTHWRHLSLTEEA